MIRLDPWSLFRPTAPSLRASLLAVALVGACEADAEPPAGAARALVAGALEPGAARVGAAAAPLVAQVPAPAPVSAQASLAQAAAPSRQAIALANDPPRVRQVAVKPSPSGKGTLLLVELEKDDRVRGQITLFPDGSPLVFSDLGPDAKDVQGASTAPAPPDEEAGDGVFTAEVGIDFESVLASRERLLDGAKRAGHEVAIEFDGRSVAGKRELLRGHAIGGLAVPFGAPAAVDPARTLMVTDPGVINDPARTFNPCSGAGTPLGAWTFGHLVQEMAGAGDPATLAEQWLRRWLAPYTVNGDAVPARPSMQAVLDGWPRLADGRLDLARAPFKLLAIVNRIDLAKNVGYAALGGAEGRFVFQWMDPTTCTASPTRPFLVIFEYGVPRATCGRLRDWAQRWKALDLLAPGSAAYNAALEALTEEFAGAGAAPGKPNGSALNQLRTNDFKLGSPWELREFRLVDVVVALPWGGTLTLPAQLAPAPVVNTPDRDVWNGASGGPRAAELGAWINANASRVSREAHSVPLAFPFAPGGPFLGGHSPNGFDFWSAPGLLGFGPASSSDMRHRFSLNTCNACHGRETSNAISSQAFTHVRAVSSWSDTPGLSGFLTGTTVNDPLVPATARSFNDLERRRIALEDLATSFCGPFPRPGADLVRLPDDVGPVLPLPPIAHRPILGAH